MRKRNASELVIHRAPSWSEIAPKEKRKMVVEQDLKRKVEESRPILETIYDKVRKKEQMYRSIIADGNEKHEKITALAREYQEIGHHAVRIINDQVLTKKEEPQEKEKERRLNRNYQSAVNLQTNYTVSSIIEEYRRSKAEPPQETVTSHSIYERYLNKLAEGKEKRPSQQRENTLQKVRKLSKEIDSDLECLKLRKNSSQSRMSKENSLKLTTAVEKPKQRKDKKAYFLQLQKRKLKLL